MLKQIWHYAIYHKWSKDILRANLFYVVLVILYNLLHFKLHPISFYWFIKCFFLMNICLILRLLFRNTKK